VSKVVVITGASGGLGAEIAMQVAKEGWEPVLLARSLNKLETVKEKVKAETGIEPGIFRLDVQDVNSVQETFLEIFRIYTAVDVLINNAGFGVFDLFSEAEMTDIEAMFQTNVIGLIACTKTVLPGMQAKNKGQIINIASQAGKIATPKSSGYTATKHAVLGFTNSLRMELADTNIKVTAVNPGPIATSFFDKADPTGNYIKNVQKYILKPDYVAQKIIGTIKRPKREVNLPGWMSVGIKLYQITPKLVEKLGGKAFRQK
jgi:short-subunit dehydrogenase